MPNAWVLFVKEYAKKNNISYGCAISKAGEEYRALKSGKKTETSKPKVIEPLKVQPMKKIESPKPIEKVIEKVKIIKTPKIIQNAIISKKEKKAILAELGANLNALKKQQSRMPSQSRLMDIADIEKRILEVGSI
jgi:hypothetical protein